MYCLKSSAKIKLYPITQIGLSLKHERGSVAYIKGKWVKYEAFGANNNNNDKIKLKKNAVTFFQTAL